MIGAAARLTGTEWRRSSPARLYDCYLGGKDNSAAERRAVWDICAIVPEAPEIALANQRFLHRAVRSIARAGVHQFIDIGTGMLTRGNVHEVAHAIDPQARVVSVDNDPAVVAHNTALLPDTSRSLVVGADLREPERIMTHPGVRRLIDFNRPLALLLVAVLHFVPDDADPWELVGRYRAAMAPGSRLAVTHVTCENQPPDTVRRVSQIYQRSSIPLTMRTRTRIHRFFTGFELLEPGLVAAPDWHGDQAAAPSPSVAWNLGGVAELT